MDTPTRINHYIDREQGLGLYMGTIPPRMGQPMAETKSEDPKPIVLNHECHPYTDKSLYHANSEGGAQKRRFREIYVQ